jgi:hypothetical protein
MASSRQIERRLSPSPIALVSISPDLIDRSNVEGEAVWRFALTTSGIAIRKAGAQLFSGSQETFELSRVTGPRQTDWKGILCETQF